MMEVLFAVSSVLLALLVLPGDWSPDRARAREEPAPRLLSREELTRCSGGPGGAGLYLSVLGQVFDVRRGERHYGPGGGYHGLAGKDASLAFVSGDFSARGLSDDVSGLSASQVVSLYDWLAFYQKDYAPVGRLVGRFYTEEGRPTQALLRLEALLEEGLRLKAHAQEESQRFPACNSEWSPSRGGRVWCSPQSGGVERAWAGVPRKRFSPGSGRSRCVCVEPSAPRDAHTQDYRGCPPHSSSCILDDE